MFGIFFIGSCGNSANIKFAESKYIPMYPYAFKDEIRKVIYLSNKHQANIEYIVSHKTMEELVNYCAYELAPWLVETEKTMIQNSPEYLEEIQRIINTIGLIDYWISTNDLDHIRDVHFIYKGENK
jgi:hypothetical protein